MKKISILVLLSFITLFSFAQRLPFVGVGTSVEDNLQNWTAAVGVFDNASKYAVEVSTCEKPHGYGEDYWKVGVRGYWKVTPRKRNNFVDVYATGAASMNLDQWHTLAIEPGVAATLNFCHKFYPQILVGLPIRENDVLRERPLGMVAGISLNYNF